MSYTVKELMENIENNKTINDAKKVISHYVLNNMKHNDIVSHVVNVHPYTDMKIYKSGDGLKRVYYQVHVKHKDGTHSNYDVHSQGFEVKHGDVDIRPTKQLPYSGRHLGRYNQ